METTKKLNETPLIQEMTADHTYVIVDSQGNVSRMNDVPKKYVTETELTDFIEPYDERITTNKTDISNLETNMTNVKTDISNLKTDMTNVKTDVSNLETNIGSTKTDVLDLETYIDTITPKNTASGEIAHTTDALPLPTFGTKSGGNVEQETTKGINKLDTSKLTTTKISGVDVTVNKDGSITFNGTMEKYIWLELSNKDFNLPSGEYTWSLRPSYVLPSGDYTIGIRDKNNTVITAAEFYRDIENVTLNEDLSNCFVAIYIGSLTTFNNFTIYPMLVEGTYTKDTIPPFEKFTNGASPNPEYPQEIEVLEGCNIFDKDNFTKLDSYFSTTQTTLLSNSSNKMLVIKCKPNTTYTIQKIPSSQNFFGYIEDEPVDGVEVKSIQVNNTNSVMTLTTSEKAKYLVARYYHLSLDTLTEQEILDSIMISEGTDKKPYLPYGCVEYKVNGKNLLNGIFNMGSINQNGIEASANNRARSSYIKIKGNKDYIFSSSNSNIYYVPYFYDNNKTFISYLDGWKSQTISFKAPENARYVRVILKNNSTNTITLDEITNSQLEQGITTTPYEPYKEQLVPLDLKGNWVGKINDDIKDYLVTDKKKYWLVKNVGKVVLDGSENWGEATSKRPTFSCNIFKDKKNGKNNFICDSFLYKGDAQMSDLGYAMSFNIDSYYNYIYIQVPSDVVAINDREAFKQWLSNNISTVYYELATPEIIELGELPEPIKTFEGVNNIQLLANLDTEIEVVYAQDVKKYIDSKLAEISAQII